MGKLWANKNKKDLQSLESLVFIETLVGLDIQTKLRFENQKSHKIKKQALYFACFFDLFVTSAGFKPATS